MNLRQSTARAKCCEKRVEGACAGAQPSQPKAMAGPQAGRRVLVQRRPMWWQLRGDGMSWVPFLFLRLYLPIGGRVVTIRYLGETYVRS